MIGYTITPEQKNLIQGQEFAPYECFNCVQDIDGVWFNFVTVQQKQFIEASEYAWVLDLPQAEYIPPIPPPFPQNEEL
jgi:hypothetical protein